MLHWILVYIYISSLICSVSKAEQGTIRIFNNDESRMDFTSLLTSLINVNEQRIKVINKLHRIQDYGPIRNFLRSLEPQTKIPGQKHKNLLILIRSNSKSVSHVRRRVTEVPVNNLYDDTDEQTSEGDVYDTRKKLVKHERQSYVGPSYDSQNSHHQVKSSMESYPESIHEKPYIDLRRRNKKVKKLIPKIRFKQTTSLFRPTIPLFDNNIDSLSDEFALVTEKRPTATDYSENKYMSDHSQNTNNKKRKKSTPENHRNRPRKDKKVIILPLKEANDLDQNTMTAHTHHYSPDGGPVITTTIKRKRKRKRILPQSMVHIPSEFPTFEKIYKPDPAIESIEPHRFSIQPHIVKNDETIVYTEKTRSPKKHTQSTTPKLPTWPTPDTLETFPSNFAEVTTEYMNPKKHPKKHKTIALKDFAAVIQTSFTTENSFKDNLLPGIDLSKKHMINLNEIPDQVQHLTLKEIADIANQAFLKDSPRLTNYEKLTSLHPNNLHESLAVTQTFDVVVPSELKNNQPVNNFLRIEMGLNSKQHSADNEVYTDVGKGVSEYVFKIADSNGDHDYKNPESAASNIDFQITDSENDNDEYKYEFARTADKLSLRKNWQKCVGKKAYKKCKKSCVNAYKKVCRQLKCTSRSKKDLKKDCKKYCKSGFNKKKKDSKDSRRSSESDSSETE